MGEDDNLLRLRELTERLRTREIEELTRYKRLVETANVLILAHDDKWQVTLMNPYACEVLGYESDEMIGQDIRPLLVAGEVERAEPVRQKVRVDPTLSVRNVEQEWWRKGRQERVTLSWNVTAVTDAVGDVVGIQGVGQVIKRETDADET